jgi:broad specificity phosphatase PhoE
MRLLLIRHGETDWNVTLQYQGHADLPLNDHGRMQASALAERLRALRPAAVYSSDLPRAVQTAEPIAAACRLELQRERDLREIDVGRWQGLTPAELRQRFPAHMAAYAADPAGTVRLGGESYAQLQVRALRCLGAIEQQHRQDETVVIVSHGGTLRTMICAVIGLELRAFGRLWLDNGSISELRSDAEGRRLVRLNDTAHLEQPPTVGGE